MSTNSVGEKSNTKESVKHPVGLYLVSFTIMWERFSYYGMRALLILFLTTQLIKGGLGLDTKSAGLIYGNFTGLVYLTPLLGGWLADKYLGQRKAVVWGSTLIALGQFALFTTHTKSMLYLGLLLLILGNGFFKPNMSSLVGQLYEKDDSRKDSAYSIFYMAINVGAFIAPLICGTLAEQIFAQKQGAEIISYGYRYGFLAAGIGMLIGQIAFMLLSNKYMKGIGKHPITKASTTDTKDSNKPLTKQEKNRIKAIFIMVFFVTFFWAGFEQAGASLTIYTKDFINRNMGSFVVPTSWFQSLNPIFCVILGPTMGALWVYLSKREKGDLTIPQKMSLGMILLGIGFLLMVGAVLQRGSAGDDVTVKANMMWLVGAYFLHTVGEMCLSPVGLSMVSKLSPPKYVSLLMGVWLFSSAIANKLAGVVASLMGTFTHMQIFGTIAGVSIVLGFMLLSLNKKLISMMQ
ncbi:peptide MFS transporter [Tepidibacter formicigenes]|jgi:POT family proton-dependent oligopeptide transporter|uniref:Proton-dependent oligopeptide transporter, POT family n=1 Tax=Tepidibacter formicigenes DSM 15518 TaxID=1123349 RepID=A0A1M6R8M6_9FIRM|nr:peptide MFS transporter [Tepidibacter formicigenes]SHK28678.1 proton-dependent oligopeptide transporter, POT family [Tepidibacter formicigenes DSM 15518]